MIPSLHDVAEVVIASGPGVAGQDVIARADALLAGLTSLELVALLLRVEAAYAIAVPADEIVEAHFSSVASVHDLVRRCRAPGVTAGENGGGDSR